MNGRGAARDRLICAVRALIVDHPLEDFSLQGLADLTGISLWVLRGRFGNVDGVFRAVAGRVLDEVETGLSVTLPVELGVVETIRAYAEFLARAMRSDDYRDLLYLVVRNGQRHAWLAAAYQERILAKTERELAEIVQRAGDRLGAPVLFKAGAARRLHRRVEAEVALPQMLPPFETRSDEEVAATLKDIAEEAFRATYAFEWGEATAA